MKHSKDIRQCPLYGGKYYADKEGNVYLDAEGKEKVGVFLEANGHLSTTTHPIAKVHRCVFYAFNPDAPVEGHCIHHLNENKTDNRLENLALLTHGEHTRLHHLGKVNENLVKPVLQYSTDYEFIAEYSSACEAGHITGVGSPEISKCCNHKPNRNTAGGYIWRWATEPLTPEQSVRVWIKPVLQYTKQGVFIAEYPSAQEAERMTGISNGDISECCNHKPYHKTAGGYIWRFKDDRSPLIPEEYKNSWLKSVLQYTKQGVFIAEYASICEAERAIGVSNSSISKVCLHRPNYKTSGGFIWRYKDDPLSPPEPNLKLF